MKLERRHAWALLAIAAWNVVTYAQFTRALATTEEDRDACLAAGMQGVLLKPARRAELRAALDEVAPA